MRFDFILLAIAALGALLPLPGIVGQLFVYPWLGLFPGLALAAFLLPRESRAMRVALGLAMSPVLATVVAWFLVRAGLSMSAAAVAIAVAGGLALAAAGFRRQGAATPDAPGPPRGAVLWAAGLAALLIAVPVINPYLFVRGDSWIHGGIVMELSERGFPPEDARMAGLRLNYVWFFNLFIALLESVRHQDLFRFMTLLNAATGFATVMLVAAIARRVWGDARIAVTAAILLTLGLNAGAFLLWPLHLVRALSGEVSGLPEVVRQWHRIDWNTAGIIYSLSAPFAEMVSFLDKLLVGTAIHFAYTQMLLGLWALVVWFGEGSRASLFLIAFASAGAMLFHSVVGLSVLPITLAVLGIAWLAHPRWQGMPARGRLALAAAAAAGGAIATLPYLRSITAGWAAEKAGFRFEFIHFNIAMPWTIATACGFVLWWMVAPVRNAWRERRALPLLLTGWAIAMTLFALVVQLPNHNEIKFVFEIFAVAVVIAAPRALEFATRWRARRPFAFAGLAALFVVPTLLTVAGYAVDPTGRTREELNPIAGEEALYAWLRRETPEDAVIVDRNFRDLIAVKAGRRLYLGTDQDPELAAFPAPELLKRRAIVRDLYGAFASPDSAFASFRAVGHPVYVVYRPNDPPAPPPSFDALARHSGAGSTVYDSAGFRVVRVAGGAGS